MTKTMTAEEVEQMTQRLREILEAHGLVKDHSGSAQNLVTVLAAQAARVPGLEEEVESLKTAVAGADRLWEQQQSRAEQAESARDAALERAVVLEQAERDLSGHVANLESVLAAERESLRLSREHVDTLRERVATLEQKQDTLISDAYRRDEQVRLANLARDKERDLRVAVQGRASALRASLSTAEARVRELEAWKAHALVLRALAGVYNSVVATLPEEAQAPFGRAGVAIVACALLNNEPKSTLEEQQAGYARYCELLGQHAPSQPPPAPAQGVDVIKAQILTINQEVNAAEAAHAELDKRGVPRDSADDEMPPGAELSLAERIRRLSPTPPPGLREAVAKLMPWVKALSRSAMEDDAMVSSVYPFAKMTVGDLRRLRAAYDATGGDKVWCPGCQQMAPVTEMHMRCTLCAAHEDDRTRNDALETSPDAEDAAKYRAAVERFKDVKATEHCTTSRSEDFRRGEVNGAAYVLGLTLSTPPAAAPQKPERPAYAGCHADRDGDCSWAECPQRTNPAHHCPLDTDEDDATPPSGPGGGEEVIPMGPFGVMAAKDAPTRARIAPTSTPEVPPFKATGHEDCPDNPCPGHHPYCEGIGRDLPPPQLAQPTTPAVLWQWRDEEGNAANVSAEGYHLHGDAEMIAGALARALAEAKREVAALKAAAEGEIKATDADRANASLAWGCAGSIQTALRRERANRMEFAKKAAEAKRELAGSVNPIALAAVRQTASESMRERAAKMAYAAYAGCVRPDCDACRIARVIESVIRALPLE